MSYFLSLQGTTVVSAAFSFAGAAFDSSDIDILYIHLSRSQAIFKVRAYRAQDYHKFICCGFSYAQEGFISEDERSDVKGSAFAFRYPILVDLDQRFDCVYEEFFVNLRYTKPVVGVIGSLSIHIRAEELNSAGRGLIGFKAFKHFLSIMEYHSCRIQSNRSIRHYSAVVPSILLVIIHDKHVVSKYGSKPQALCIRFGLGSRCLGYRKFIFHFGPSFRLFNTIF